jgi:hypothetical protein
MIFADFPFSQPKETLKEDREENYKILQEIKKDKSQRSPNGNAISNKHSISKIVFKLNCLISFQTIFCHKVH